MESANSSLLAFLLAVICLLLTVKVNAQSRVDEVRTLTSFLGALDTNMSHGYWFSWNENDENACAWIGVTCTTNFTVAALDLSGWGLNNVGSFAALSKLPDLLRLDMSSNNLGHRIPDDISSLTQLTLLDLSRNALYGQISPNISSCRSLQYLSLEENQLEGAIPDLSDLVHLQFLLLARNNLNGSFPQQLGEMSSLVTIDLSGNQMSGQIPSLVNSKDLVNLRLDDNLFVGFEEPLNLNAPNLQQWRVSGNQLEGTIPLAIANLPNLWFFDMSCNRLSGNIPSGFLYQPGPRIFDLSQNELTGSIPVDLLDPPETASVSINVSHNLLNGSIPTPTVTSQGVRVLDLCHNQLEGSIPSPLMNISYLDLHNNFLSGDIVDVLVDCQTFQASGNVLLLRNNFLTGDLSRMTYKWGNWSDLLLFDLSNNNLSWTTTESVPDPLTAALNNFPSTLTQFQVGGNNFSGTSLPFGPLSLVDGNLRDLQVLDFSNNYINGTISCDVFNATALPHLHFLNLSCNEATGPVPETIISLFTEGAVGDSQTGELSKRVLDLSNNKLSGLLPFIPVNSTLSNPSVFRGNRVCGYPLRPCLQDYTGSNNFSHYVLWPSIVSMIITYLVLPVLLVATVAWQWRLYSKRHEQDADLIQTLMERDSATLMSLRELTRATNNFCDSARIGEGGCGTVYMGNLNNGTKVAIKRSKRGGSQEDKQQFLNEVRILSQVNHRHLVKLLGCCMENKNSLLIFEFVSNGTLQDHLRGTVGDVGLSWKQRLTIAVQTADALNYLHCGTCFPIYHRDVKSANILLNDDLSTKVADFGISRLATMDATYISTAGVGTIGYIDPEYFTYHHLSDRSDVYSLGVVLLELISAKGAVFQMDGEGVNLVMFAIPHIESGDMQPLIDPRLLETYNHTSGHGKESMLNVGRLAMECLAMTSKGRPSMTEVWIELQNIFLKLDGASMNEDFGSMNEDNLENPSCDHTVLFPHIFSNHNYNFDVENDSKSLELCYTI